MLPGFDYDALLAEARQYVALSDQLPFVARGEQDSKNWCKQRQLNRERLRELVNRYDQILIRKNGTTH